ncbi:hypothetical protein OsI_19084 [Oryza sativa Indica Group]|nr:hypothetical protein OsI_19084 [Oryza sativa Indica Group]
MAPEQPALRNAEDDDDNGETLCALFKPVALAILPMPRVPYPKHAIGDDAIEGNGGNSLIKPLRSTRQCSTLLCRLRSSKADASTAYVGPSDADGLLEVFAKANV